MLSYKAQNWDRATKLKIEVELLSLNLKPIYKTQIRGQATKLKSKAKLKSSKTKVELQSSKPRLSCKGQIRGQFYKTQSWGEDQVWAELPGSKLRRRTKLRLSYQVQSWDQATRLKTKMKNKIEALEDNKGANLSGSPQNVQLEFFIIDFN